MHWKERVKASQQTNCGFSIGLGESRHPTSSRLQRKTLQCHHRVLWKDYAIRKHINLHRNTPGITALLYYVTVSYYYYNYRWGCTHEKSAIDAYTQNTTSRHQNFTVSEVGLFLNETTPFIGASPDGLIEWTCCGKGTLGIKCPYCFQENLPEEDTENFCMHQENGEWRLKKISCILLPSPNTTCSMQLAIWGLRGVDKEWYRWRENQIWPCFLWRISWNNLPLFYIPFASWDHWEMVHMKAGCR